MNQIEIKISVDPSTEQGRNALKHMVEALTCFGEAHVPITHVPLQATTKEEEVTSLTDEFKLAQGRKNKRVRITETIVDDKDVTDIVVEEAEIVSAEEPKKAKKEKGEDAEVAKIDIETVRSTLSKKVHNHREAIKKKLTDLGTENVTNLDPEHYGAFVDFLNKLN